MSSGEVSASRVAMLNAILADHQHGANKFMLGGDVRPTFCKGLTPGSIQVGAVNRKTDESVVIPNKKSDKMATVHFITGVVKLNSAWLDVRRSLEKAKAVAKETGKPQKQTNQSVTFELSSSDERLKSSEVAMDDLKNWFTEDVTKAWWENGFRPNRTTKQTDNYDEYKSAMEELIMDTQSSPYTPLVETEVNGEMVTNFKASSKFTPFGTDSRAEDIEIAEAAGGDVAEYLETNPNQRIKFVELIHADGRKVKPSEYWEMVDTAFGAGALVIVTLMCAYGGVTVFEGTKTSVQPKLVSIQEVERVAGNSSGSSGGACNLIEMLAKYETSTDAATQEDPLDGDDEDDDSAGSKRKSSLIKQKKSKGKRAKVALSDEQIND